jgi:hypothetical protein
MRRACSIVAIIAMVSSLISPVWASSAEAAHPMLCHRVRTDSAQAPAKHHCHDMDQEAAKDEAAPTLVQGQISQSCPMNCCVQATLRIAAALHSNSFLPQLVTLESRLHVTAIVFSSTGFSSHTDRGPPQS